MSLQIIHQFKETDPETGREIVVSFSVKEKLDMDPLQILEY